MYTSIIGIHKSDVQLKKNKKKRKKHQQRGVTTVCWWWRRVNGQKNDDFVQHMQAARPAVCEFVKIMCAGC